MKPDRPRVLHVINSIGLGGVPEAAYQLLDKLPSGEFDRNLIILRPFQPEDRVRQDRFEKFTALDIPITFLPPGSHKLTTVTQLVEFLSLSRYDLIHTHSYRPNLFARLAALTDPKIKVVGHYHNDYDANWTRDGTLPLDRRLAQRSDGHIACSRSVRDHVASRLGISQDAVRVIHNGVDTRQFTKSVDRATARARLALPSEGPIVTLVGRICHQKNQTALIQAAPTILTHHPKVTFAFAGNPDDEAAMQCFQTEIAASGLSRNLVHLGFVQDMPTLYAATDILVAPSRWEGFGLMLVEAMAAGVPIVASQVGGIPEVVDDACAVLIEPEDVPELAQSVSDLLASPSRLYAMSAAGRGRSEAFGWQHAATAVAAYYRDLLDQRHSR